jgi:hypothetical protein
MWHVACAARHVACGMWHVPQGVQGQKAWHCLAVTYVAPAVVISKGPAFWVNGQGCGLASRAFNPALWPTALKRRKQQRQEGLSAALKEDQRLAALPAKQVSNWGCVGLSTVSCQPLGLTVRAAPAGCATTRTGGAAPGGS